MTQSFREKDSLSIPSATRFATDMAAARLQSNRSTPEAAVASVALTDSVLIPNNSSRIKFPSPSPVLNTLCEVLRATGRVVLPECIAYIVH